MTATRTLPQPMAILELLKPITWFPPMWAFACGVVASGTPINERWSPVVGGIILSGPLVCAMSQAVNDWFDRDVDAINEPLRPIPSQRIPGRWGLYIAMAWTVLSLCVSALLGTWVALCCLVGVILAWAYSAPPLRLKQNGWWGNAACSFAYEGLSWVTGHAVMLDGGLPSGRSLLLALLYSLGAHGIMTLNDFKSIRGDQQMGISSLPVMLGPQRAAEVACVIMILPQMVVAGLLLSWGRPWEFSCLVALIGTQIFMMRRFRAAPVQQALWYSGFGVPLFVLGMMVSAYGARGAA